MKQCKSDGCYEATAKNSVRCSPCSNLWFKYRLTSPKRKEMLDRQDGKCLVCSKHLVVAGTKTPNQACVDHNHHTGEVRGILCRQCNTALGLLQEDPSIMKNLIKYINGGSL